MASSQTSVASKLRSNPIHHLHPVGDTCPVCDQPIPHERADEIAERLQAREQEQSATITARLQEKFDTEKTEALEAARLEREQKVAAAREEARQAAELQLKARLDEAEQARAAAQAALQAKTDEADMVKTQAEAAQAELRGELDQTKRDGEVAIEKLKAEAAEKEAGIRAEAVAEATTAAEARITETEAQKASAEQAGAALKAELETTKLASAQALEQAQAQAAAREVEARAEATAAAAAAAEKVSAAEQAKAEAEAKAAAVEAQAITLQQTHEAQLDARLQEQREALQADKTAALNAEKSAAFEERLKLSNKVEELSRALEKKTAEELGEGAEVDLFEALKAEFGGDRIQRVNKGQPGADILHTVIHNGRECGTIIYDSKNHSAWRDNFVTKLKSDQLAARAEHAILSTRKFPAGGQQLHIRDGVVIAGPARVVALVQLIRAHLVHTHALRMSAEQRSQKTDALYVFITSQQCTDMFTRLDEQATTLLEIDAKELKAHQAVWKQRGIVIQTAVKVQAELRNQIDSIIGTASSPETES